MVRKWIKMEGKENVEKGHIEAGRGYLRLIRRYEFFWKLFAWYLPSMKAIFIFRFFG